MENYSEYIVRCARELNKQIKNSVNYQVEDLLRILLIDYVKDTLDNYDYRNCPEYDGKEDPIIPDEGLLKKLITDDFQFIILSEDDDILISEDSDYEVDADYLEVEDSEDYMSTESNYDKTAHAKLLIERFLNKLIKSKTCLR